MPNGKIDPAQTRQAQLKRYSDMAKRTTDETTLSSLYDMTDDLEAELENERFDEAKREER